MFLSGVPEVTAVRKYEKDAIVRDGMATPPSVSLVVAAYHWATGLYMLYIYVSAPHLRISGCTPIDACKTAKRCRVSKGTEAWSHMSLLS